MDPSPSPQSLPDAGTDSSADRDALAQIERIRADKSHGYHRGDARAVDEMAALLLRASGESASEFARPSVGYEVTLPDGYTEDHVPTPLKQGFEGLAFDLGADRRTGQAIFDGALGYAPLPDPGAVPPSEFTADRGRANLQKEFGQDYTRQHEQAWVAVRIMDHHRHQQGHGQADLLTWLDATGYGSHPKVVKLFATLGGHYKVTEQAAYRHFAGQLAARRQSRG